VERYIFLISWVIQGGTDGRNPLRRFHKVLRIVRSCGGARRLRREDSEELKLGRRLRVIHLRRTGGRDW
jgi:hypothetical protein